jgi:LEA14-like dessication related protein
MRKKTVTILIVISTVINIFAAAFIFLDLQVMQAPDTTISMEIVEINSKEAVIKSKIDIDNPNGFEIIVREI